jgi:hypothetical protein
MPLAAQYDGTPITGWTSTLEPCTADSGLSPWWIFAAVVAALLLLKPAKEKEPTRAR